MTLAPGENVRLRRQDVYEKSRLGLTWLASMAGVASAMLVWFLVVQGQQAAQSGDTTTNLVVNNWLNMLAFGMAALSSAAVVGALVMRAQRDATAIG